MGFQQVKTKIVLVITPHRVNMISLILRAIHLDQEAGCLDTVIMQATAFNCARPGEEGGVLGCFRAGSMRLSAIACGTFEAYNSTVVPGLRHPEWAGPGE